jgi:ABC-2 type transport system permease protein
MNSTPDISRPATPSTLRRYFGIYTMLWRNALVREMGFKVNFILWIFVEMLWFALQLAFIAVIYSHTDRIDDWSQWQVVLLMSTGHFVQQIFTAMFLSNCVQVSDHIRTGRLDFMMLLPANLRFLLSFRVVDFGAFINAASAIAVMIYAGSKLGLTPTLLQMIGFLLLCVASLLVHYSLMFLLTTTSFWTVKAQGVVWGYYNLFNLSRLPDSVFKGGFKVFFTFVLPMLLVANVPAKLIVQKLNSPLEMLLLVAMSLACFAVSEAVWRFSLKRYTSASS